jgi:HEAT repeat protein
LLQQSLLQQRQLLQQQQLQLQILQQVQQQQLLQTARLKRQMRELADKGPEALKAALNDPNAELRLIAALAIGKYGPALTDDLIERLTDENASVRQAARRSLVRLNTSAGRRNVDFGPAEGANRVAQKSSARQWHTWFEQQQAKAANLKTGTAAAPAILPKIPLLAAEASAARRDAVLSKPGGP